MPFCTIARVQSSPFAFVEGRMKRTPPRVRARAFMSERARAPSRESSGTHAASDLPLLRVRFAGSKQEDAVSSSCESLSLWLHFCAENHEESVCDMPITRAGSYVNVVSAC